MRFETKIGSNGEITIPPDLLSELCLPPETMVAVELTLSPVKMAGTPIDREALRQLIEELRPSMIAKMRADGYNSVDEYIDDIRGR